MRRGRAAAVVAVLAGLLVAAPAMDLQAAPATVEGQVLAFGDAPPVPGRAPEDAVAIAASPSGLGWWAAAADGVVAAAGAAPHLGDLAEQRLNRPVVGMAATPTGAGYWLVASDGGIFAFGDAPFLGSTGALRLNRPVVGMATTASGRGYWLVASDGGIFTFGDARFLGSTGGVRLNQPVVGLAATPSGGGYWLAAADGGIFTFGDAAFRGAGRAPVTAIARTPSGGGYWLAGGDGHVDARGDAPDAGGTSVVDGTVRGLAPTPSGRGYWLAVGRVADVVTVSEPGGLREASTRWALDAAARVGARATVYHSGNVDLLAVRRGQQVVQAAPPGWRIPMAALAVEPRWAVPLVGRRAADALERGELVLGARSAAFRGAAIGDEVELLGWDGRARTYRVGALVPDARAGATELLLATAQAAGMGFQRPASVKIWGAPRDRMEAGLAAVPPPTRLGIGRTWAPEDPDGVASLIHLKEVLGEPAYRPGGGGDAVVLHPAFTARITSQRVPLLGSVTCHQAVFPALRGALDEVARAGLGGGLGSFGGCYNPRLVRGGDSGGSLSRHSFGIAVDVNVRNNVFGGRVSMDGRIVEIFRRWGFAWGGTWTRPDGMHFEWRAT